MQPPPQNLTRTSESTVGSRGRRRRPKGSSTPCGKAVMGVDQSLASQAQSYRNARIGAVRLARRAGSHPAPNATAVRSNTALTNTKGSCPSSP